MQISTQLFLPVPAVPGAYVDNSYVPAAGSTVTATNPNPDVTLAQNASSPSNGASYTVTPNSGYCGVEVAEVMGFTPVSGTFELQVGTATLQAITFDSTNLTATADNMQTALRQLTGVNTTTVTVDPSSTAPNFLFNVNFGSSNSEAAIAYVSAATALPVTMTNSVATGDTGATQQLTFADTGTFWDAPARRRRR